MNKEDNIKRMNMDTLRDFFEEKRRERENEAVLIPPMGAQLAAMIETRQIARRKHFIYWWIAGGLAFVLATAGVGLYFRSYVASFFTRIAEIFVQITGNITDYLKITGTSLAAGLSGARETAASGIIEKATSEMSGWPVQVWYVVFLAGGVALLLGVDRLVRHRKTA
ncbi:MAG: hypothetical protein WC262_11735 [Bacteroidales bacterium]|jgi:hypothetical protein